MPESMQLPRSPVVFQPTPEHSGPSLTASCPCGSHLPIRSCHGDDEGEWHLPRPEPLITGPRTLYAHGKCYAALSNDCSATISREHWVSRNILDALAVDNKVRVAGQPWLKGGTKELPVHNLSANILCERHNNALSSLDSIAGELFNALVAYQYGQDDPDSPVVHGESQILVLSGPHFELWLLKFSVGGLAARSFGQDGRAVTAIDETVPVEALLDILFRGAQWPPSLGLYGYAEPDARTESDFRLAAVAVCNRNREIIGVDVRIDLVRFYLLIKPLDDLDGPLYRPGRIVLRHRVHPGQRVLGLAWPDNGHLASFISQQS